MNVKRLRALQPRLADASVQSQEFNPRGDNDGAAHRPGESRSPCLGPVARYREERARYNQAKAVHDPHDNR